jgi:hypothetical protein
LAIIRCLGDSYNSGNGLRHHRRTKTAYVTSYVLSRYSASVPILLFCFSVSRLRYATPPAYYLTMQQLLVKRMEWNNDVPLTT